MKTVISFLSRKVKSQAKKFNVDYSFLFMKASGHQLEQITLLVEGGIIIPVIDKVFLFEETNEAMAYVESGREKEKLLLR